MIQNSCSPSSFIFAAIYAALFILFAYYLIVELRLFMNNVEIKQRPRIPFYSFITDIIISTGRTPVERDMHHRYFNNNYSRILALVTSTLSFPMPLYLEVMSIRGCTI